MNTVLNANMNESSNKLVKGFYPNTELGIDLKIAKVQIEAAEGATAHAEGESSWIRATITNSNGGGPIAVYGEVIIQDEP